MEASITLNSIGKRFNNSTLLADLSFGVEKSTTFALIGSNSSGKSTILKLLVGIVEKDAGIAYINGKDIHTRSKEIRSITGYMSQNIDLDNELSVIDNLIISARLHGLDHKTAKRNCSYQKCIRKFSRWRKIEIRRGKDTERNKSISAKENWN